jgi:hypothetical protein
MIDQPEAAHPSSLFVCPSNPAVMDFGRNFSGKQDNFPFIPW